MSGERKNGYSGQLEKTKDKLRRYSLFSKNDFSSPVDILKRSDELVELFRENVWKRRGFANNVFVDYVKSKDPAKIKYSDLLSSIFSLYKHDDVLQKLHGNISVIRDWSQIEINDVIESLIGNKTDYVENKKDFLLTKKVLPAYLVVRSFKEIDDRWFKDIMTKFDSQQRQELLDRVINLKNNLLIGVDSSEAKLIISNQFKKSLKTLQIKKADKQKIEILSKKVIEAKEKEELKKRTDSVIYGMIEVKKEDIENLMPLISTYFERMRAITLISKGDKIKALKDSNLTEEPPKSESFIPENILNKVEIDLNKGGLIIKIINLSRISKDVTAGQDEDFRKIINTLDPPEMAAFLTIVNLSSDKKYNHFVQPTNADLPIITSFSKVFKEISQNKVLFSQLYKIYRKEIYDESQEKREFYHLNKEIAGLLYKSVKNGPYTGSRLDTFLKTPYCKKAILALKKLFVLKLLNINGQKEILYLSGVKELNQLNVDFISTDSGKFISRKKQNQKQRIISSLE